MHLIEWLVVRNKINRQLFDNRFQAFFKQKCESFAGLEMKEFFIFFVIHDRKWKMSGLWL